MSSNKPETIQDYLKKYPCICSHIICHSLGYATPSMAASILKAAKEGEKHYCEWISSCYAGDPKPAVHRAIKTRHNHKGFMSDYRLAKALVYRANKTGEEPIFASWF